MLWGVSMKTAPERSGYVAAAPTRDRRRWPDRAGRGRFRRRINDLAGETGSGKTMLVGALEVALGGRVEPMGRRGAGNAPVCSTFAPDAGLRERLGRRERAGRREERGRSSARRGEADVRAPGSVASPSTAAYVREIGARDRRVVGQGEAQPLLLAGLRAGTAGPVRAAIDAGGARRRSRERYASAAERREARAALRADERARTSATTTRALPAREIDAAAEPDEDERLRERRGCLDNVERIARRCDARTRRSRRRARRDRRTRRGGSRALEHRDVRAAFPR